MQSHDGQRLQIMGLFPILWTHIFLDLITRSLTDGTHHR